MNATHTPGPWAYEQRVKGGIAYAVYQQPTEAHVALVDGTTDANARLIAAAPELLAALRKLVAAVESGDGPNICVACNNACGAIHKATGGEG